MKDWKRKAWIALGLAVMGIGLLVLPFFQWLSAFSYDLMFAIRPNVEVNEALVVYLDDASRTHYHQPVQGPWDHRLHTRLLEQLRARHAKAVVFDILFDTPGTNQVVDQEFAGLIQDYGRVVLAASCSYRRTGSQPTVSSRLIRAAEPMGSAPWGVAELPVEADQTIRRHHADARYSGLAWKVAELVGEAPDDPTRERWLNYYGPKEYMPNVSFQQVLEPGAIPDSMISNRVVFVGMAPIITYDGSRSADVFRTPHTRWGGEFVPGVEIQTVAALNLMRSDWLSRLPSILECALLFGLSISFSFGLPLFSSRWLILAGLTALVFMGAAALTSAILLKVWFPWAIVSLVQVPAALGCAFWNRTIPTASDTVTGEAPQVPDHELIRVIGEGAYGQVWLARTVMGTYRAVKFVFRAAFNNETPFEREYQGIKNFEPISRTHEGFVDILQVGRNESAGYFYCVMEVADDCESGPAFDPATYVPKTLAKEIARRRQLPQPECLAIAIALSEALERLHRVGLVHRDIKPSNVVFVAGMPKLADIGLVADVKTAKSFVGTEGFIPPEGPGTPQADIYSLGMVLYEISMGKDCGSFPQLPTNLADNTQADGLWELNQIILRACARDRQERYQTAQQMREDLVRLASRPSQT